MPGKSAGPPNASPTLKSALILVGPEIERPSSLENRVLRYPLRLPGPQDWLEVVATLARSTNHGPRWNLQLPNEEQAHLLSAQKGLTLNHARQAISRATIHNRRFDGNAVSILLDQKVEAPREGGHLEYHPCKGNPSELGDFQKLSEVVEKSAHGLHSRSQVHEPHTSAWNHGGWRTGLWQVAEPKAIVRAWSLTLLQLDMGSLYNKHMGEAENTFAMRSRWASFLHPGCSGRVKLKRLSARGPIGFRCRCEPTSFGLLPDLVAGTKQEHFGGRNDQHDLSLVHRTQAQGTF